MITAFCVCLPLLLLPAVLAFWNRKQLRFEMALINVAGIVGAFFWIRALFPAMSANIPMVGVLGAMSVIIGAWLLLLHFATRKDASAGADLDEDVHLMDYDAAWPALYAQERQRIAAALALADGDLEHIGSTAVPGLLAKPVVDMMLGAATWPPVPAIAARLGILGYENLGEAGVPERVYLRRRDGQHFNLHIVKRGGVHWVNNLAFRERLRRDSAARESYAAAKRAALAPAGTRLLAYTGAKSTTIQALLREL